MNFITRMKTHYGCTCFRCGKHIARGTKAWWFGGNAYCCKEHAEAKQAEQEKWLTVR